MALVVPNQGEQITLEALLNKTAPQNLVLRLYTNDLTPGESDVEGDYTEATFAGYSSVTLTGSSWTVTPGAPTTATYAEQTFTRSSTGVTQNVYGYYVTQSSSGKLVYAERFNGAPLAMTNSGDAIIFTPTITCD